MKPSVSSEFPVNNENRDRFRLSTRAADLEKLDCSKWGQLQGLHQLEFDPVKKSFLPNMVNTCVRLNNEGISNRCSKGLKCGPKNFEREVQFNDKGCKMLIREETFSKFDLFKEDSPFILHKKTRMKRFPERTESLLKKKSREDDIRSIHQELNESIEPFESVMPFEASKYLSDPDLTNSKNHPQVDDEISVDSMTFQKKPEYERKYSSNKQVKDEKDIGDMATIQNYLDDCERRNREGFGILRRSFNSLKCHCLN